MRLVRIFNIIFVEHFTGEVTCKLTQKILYTAPSSFLQFILKLKFTGLFPENYVVSHHETGCPSMINSLHDSLIDLFSNHVNVIFIFFKCLKKVFRKIVKVRFKNFIFTLQSRSKCANRYICSATVHESDFRSLPKRSITIVLLFFFRSTRIWQHIFRPLTTCWRFIVHLCLLIWNALSFHVERGFCSFEKMSRLFDSARLKMFFSFRALYLPHHSSSDNSFLIGWQHRLRWILCDCSVDSILNTTSCINLCRRWSIVVCFKYHYYFKRHQCSDRILLVGLCVFLVLLGKSSRDRENTEKHFSRRVVPHNMAVKSWNWQREIGKTRQKK